MSKAEPPMEIDNPGSAGVRSTPGKGVRSEIETSDTAFEGDEAYCVACNQSFPLDEMYCPTDGSKLIKLRSSPDQLIGRVFDQRYELRAVLGQGGMGTVYRAWQRSVDREVAVKVIHPKLASVREVAKRFLREARLASQLNQQNIVSVYDFGQSDDGVLYLVMELLRGRPLSDELRAHEPQPVRRIIAIAAQICDALDAAHHHGIVHRDLKPHNVIVLDDPPGRDLIKILDFGLAKSLMQQATSLVTQSDAVLGTPAYISPEQILGKPVDPRTDLYALGCILYQMASGRPPFRGETLNAVLGMHLRSAPPVLPESTPPTLAMIIARLMAKEPQDRPATAALVHAAITSMSSGGAFAISELGQPSSSGAVGANGQRRVGRIAAVALATVAVAVAVVAFLPMRRDQRGGATESMKATSSDRLGTDGSSSAVVRDASIDLSISSPGAAPTPLPQGNPRRPSEVSDGGTTDATRRAASAGEPKPATVPPTANPRHVADSPIKATTRVRPRAESPAEPVRTGKPRDRAVDNPSDAGLPDLDLIPSVRRTPL